MKAVKVLKFRFLLGIVAALLPLAVTAGGNTDASMNGGITVQGYGGGAADLAVQSVDATNGTYAPGDSISTLIQIRNIGNAASEEYTVYLVFSIDSSISEDDIEISHRRYAALAANQLTGFYMEAKIPGNIVDGDYFIGAYLGPPDADYVNDFGVDNTPITVTVADSFVINNGLNDTWRNVDTRGQGFFITVFPDTSPDRPEPVMFVGWFTYDLERPAADATAILGDPGHRWLTAYGPYSGHTANLDIELTQGGIFDSGVPAPTQGPYGTMRVQFTSCSKGLVAYAIPSLQRGGTVPIERVANDNVALCESLQTP